VYIKATIADKSSASLSLTQLLAMLGEAVELAGNLNGADVTTIDGIAHGFGSGGSTAFFIF
jgi:hypothetical protein